MQRKLQRTTFQKMVYEALADFLNNEPLNELGEFSFLDEPKDFDPLEIPNRVSHRYVPDGLWKRLICNHINKYKSN